MKALTGIFLTLVVSNFAFGLNFIDLHKYEAALEKFEFSDQYGGCDEAIDGRWFLHFQPDGRIEIGLWSSEPERKLKYHLDEENSPHVDVDDIFSEEPRWRRINSHTLEIKNNNATYLFTMTPNFGANSPENSTTFLRFYEVGGKGRVFMIGFLPRYEDSFKVSKQFR